MERCRGDRASRARAREVILRGSAKITTSTGVSERSRSGRATSTRVGVQGSAGLRASTDGRRLPGAGRGAHTRGSAPRRARACASTEVSAGSGGPEDTHRCRTCAGSARREAYVCGRRLSRAGRAPVGRGSRPGRGRSATDVCVSRCSRAQNRGFRREMAWIQALRAAWRPVGSGRGSRVGARPR
jgi:hypothetical protein